MWEEPSHEKKRESKRERKTEKVERERDKRKRKREKEMGKKGKRENEKSRIKRKEVSPRKLVFAFISFLSWRKLLLVSFLSWQGNYYHMGHHNLHHSLLAINLANHLPHAFSEP